MWFPLWLHEFAACFTKKSRDMRKSYSRVGGGEKGYQFGGRKGASCVVTLWPCLLVLQPPLQRLFSGSQFVPVSGNCIR
jgi:hypothetical protein